ncbi:ComF family protein [Anaerobacterium chartisolvens]|uniref:ComF family protein n=1 Tax=Anaerobacterium chartisolvens TaxID=1297424 RepID=UPI000DF1FE78|nr:ComF family protein [Anaerobacterium chartisolvens]
MTRDPIRIWGNWEEGYAIDLHTISSNYLGDNEYGHPIFDTKRSEIGELLYKLKYRHNKEIIDDIIKMINPFVSTWTKKLNINVIIPIPPSNKSREYQPVDIIAEALASKLNLYYCNNFLIKNSDVQSKNLDDKNVISHSMTRNKHFTKKVNVLLIDDLYKSGASMNEAVRVLSEDRNVANVYVLALTKARRS